MKSFTREQAPSSLPRWHLCLSTFIITHNRQFRQLIHIRFYACLELCRKEMMNESQARELLEPSKNVTRNSRLQSINSSTCYIRIAQKNAVALNFISVSAKNFSILSLDNFIGSLSFNSSLVPMIVDFQFMKPWRDIKKITKSNQQMLTSKAMLKKLSSNLFHIESETVS